MRLGTWDVEFPALPWSTGHQGRQWRKVLMHWSEQRPVEAAEAMAIRSACKLILSMRWNRCIIESDNAAIIKRLQEPTTSTCWECQAIEEDIKILIADHMMELLFPSLLVNVI
ncbi:hypothetical protein COLO4_10572 [Corchorus olitorius]|uniref:RNase H type-1 domain-containing protein n=1 Tax=Corchorus olitorius TaxID=93759 RepID=A0A1R3K827_9ROSI|nr:hypothetical protein COLO4_10572 [Corchorus olitorius]